MAHNPLRVVEKHTKLAKGDKMVSGKSKRIANVFNEAALCVFQANGSGL